MRRNLLPLLEQAHGAGEVAEEEVLDVVLALGKAFNRMGEDNGSKYCFERAKVGYDRLLGKDSVKATEAAFLVASQLLSIDETSVEYKRLWEKVSLPQQAVTYDITNQLGSC